MKKANILFVAIILLLSACAPKVSTNLSKTFAPLDYTEEVMVFTLEEPFPQESEDIGVIKIGDSGFTTQCDWSNIIELAKLEARKAGGNAIKITEHTPPNLASTCHRITATILKVDNLEEQLSESLSEEDNVLANADYALLHIYRFGGVGSMVGYDLYLGDSVLVRVKNNWKETVMIKKDGLNTLWAKTESKVEIPVDIEIGKEYYIRCAVTMGAFVGRPKIDLVSKSTGRAEFASIKEKE